MKSPKAPKPTAQELAGVARQSRMIDEETEQLEKRLKATARGKLGSKSLLAKASSKASSKAASKASGKAYGAGMLGAGNNFGSFFGR